MIYTQRRANARVAGLAWVHGTDIGMASSDDGGLTWTYRGTLDLKREPGHNTYWAPDVYYEDGTYYLFVSYVQGVPSSGFETAHDILLFTGASLWDLSFRKEVNLQSARVIDPSVIKLAEDKYRMWYKDEDANYTIHYADSEDLLQWEPQGQAVDTTNSEGPNVFEWQGKYWMMRDSWDGLDLFSSVDAEEWNREGKVLEGVGQRGGDTAKGHHPSVVPSGEYAYVFYHVRPEARFGPSTSWAKIGYRQRRSVIQVGRLRMKGDKIVFDRDAPFPLVLEEASGRRLR